MIVAHRQQTEVIARGIKDRLEDEKRILEQVANTEIVRMMNPTQADKYLADIVKTSTKQDAPVYSHILITDINGAEIVHSMGVHSVPPASLKGRDYYEGAKNGKSLICMPNISKSTGRKVFPMAVPVMEAGQYKGTLAGFLTMEYVSSILAESKIGQNGYSIIMGKGADGQEGRIIASPVKEDLWNRILVKDENPQLRRLGELMQTGKRDNVEVKVNETNYRVSIVPVGLYDWSIAVFTPTYELINQAKLNHIRYLFFGGILVTISILVIVSLLMANRIVRPINTLTNELRELSEKGGDLSRKIRVDSSDEIGELGNYVNQFLGNIREIVKRVTNTSEQLAASSEELTASAEQSTQAVNQVANSISNVAEGTEKQLKAVNDTTMVVGQMAAGIQQIVVSMNTVAGTSTESAEAAQQGNKMLEKAIEQMKHIENTVNRSSEVVIKLGDRSKEIGQIVDAIDGIAGQTNLLALNAAIEAARAGEAGRGFAVVAEEVRKLAEQSQEAAKQIGALINEIQQNTDKAVVAMKEGTGEVRGGTEAVIGAGKTFIEVFEAFHEVSKQIREISAAAKDMLSGSDQIVGSIHEIDSITKDTAGQAQNVSAATQEQFAQMEEVTESSRELAKLAGELQMIVARFKL